MNCLIVTALALLLLSGCAVSEHTATNQEQPTGARSERIVADTSTLIPQGWHETVISVGDLEEMSSFYTDVMGWEILSQGEVGREVLDSWNLPPAAMADYALVGNPGADTGFVRIVKFAGVGQVRVRDHAQAWETGGIYNMNIRVGDMAEMSRRMTEAGWQAVSAPVQFTFGPFLVWEWIPRHKDGVRIAISERVKPPLEGWPNLKISSRAFNSTQIVRNMNEALDFYQGILGFKTYLEHRGVSPAPADHVLGMSREAMMQIERVVYIVNPYGTKNDGSIELLEFEGYSGRDFTDRAVPPNLGNLMLRYRVPNVEKLAAYLLEKDVRLKYAPFTRILEPYGTVKILAIRAPDGAWLEFYEIV